MIQEMFNIVGFHIETTLAGKHSKALTRYLDLGKFGVGSLGYDERLYTKARLEEELEKEEKFSGDLSGERSLSILSELTPRDLRLILRAEDELNQVVFLSWFWS